MPAGRGRPGRHSRRGRLAGAGCGRVVRDGAWVADITGLLDLDGWPAGMRVIVRKERPYPGTQLHSHEPGPSDVSRQDCRGSSG